MTRATLDLVRTLPSISVVVAWASVTRGLRWSAQLALAFSCAACCSTRECPSLQVQRTWRTEYSESGEHDTSLQRLLREHPDEAVHVLVLSGGGSNGAWGAGVLNGWRAHSSDPRPRFHVVTGISTGALIATFAFLGTEKDDAALEEAYTTVSKEDIYVDRSKLSLLFSNSLATLEPLGRLIAKHVTNEVIDRVAEEGRTSKRRLYVGTVNLDQGRLKIWDMTALAMGADEARYNKYRSILVAAAAIPALFPPVMIDGSLHVDGGAREQLFVRKIMLPLGIEQEEEQRRGRVLTITMHVLVNGKLGVGTECVQDCLLPIALRSVTLLLDANIMGNLLQSKYLADAFKVNWRLCRIPDDVEANPDSHAFITAEMQALYRRGVIWGQGGTPQDRWEVQLPEMEDATRRMLKEQP